MPVSARLYRPASPVSEIAAEAIVSALEAEDGLLWVDVPAPTAQDVDLLARTFGLHPLLAEDLLHARQRPKAERYGYLLLIVAYGAELPADGRLALGEVAMLVGRRFLVTVRHDAARELDVAAGRMAQAPPVQLESAAFLLYAVLDELVDSYTPVVREFSKRIDEIENMLLSERYERRRLSAAFAFRRDMLALRSVSAPLEEVLDTICNLDEQVLARQLDAELRDVRDHVLRAVERLDGYDHLLQASTNLYLSGVSADLNEVVLRVSSWAAILVVPTLIAGIYGMNFRHMPELGWRFGYGYALGVMVVSSVALWWSFRRRGWL